MSTPLARALLDWYRAHICDDNPRSAWHTLHRNGPLALTACTTPEDFAIVADAMLVAGALVQELRDPLLIDPPPGYTVHFINQRASVLYQGALLYTVDI